MNEHGRKPDQPMHSYLRNCSYYQEWGQLYSLTCDDEAVNIDIKEQLINAVLNNCHIIDENNNWLQLSFLEPTTLTLLNLKLMMVWKHLKN